MRAIWGWVLCALGVLGALLGLAVAVYLGPDSRRTTGPHAIETDGSVVVTAPDVIDWQGVQVDVLVEVPVRKPVFVGLGHDVDVQDLVTDVEHLEVTGFSTPWTPRYEQVEGELPTVQGAPTSFDWWLADSAGLGGASLSTTLPNEPVSLAVVSIGATNLQGLEVTLAYGVKGGFAKGLGLLLLGLGVVLGGRGLIRSRSDDDAVEETDDDGEVVYLWVDDDGVERELTADEVAAGGFDVVDESAPETDDPVVYVWVDDDGVEHEVTADEALSDEYEIVDDEEPKGGDHR